MTEIWTYEPPKGKVESKVVSEIDLLRADLDREERLRRRADTAIIGALLAILAGIAIALAVSYAQADEAEDMWTWQVAPSDRLGAEPPQRVSTAEEDAWRAVETPREIGQRAAEGAREAEYAPETYIEPTYCETAPQIESYAPSYGDGFASEGVRYEDGTRYTWYSSNAAYHYRTPEWSVDGEGFYRDSDGYYVVASTDVPMGGTVETPWGEGKVYDTGCDSGTVDMYTAF